MREAQRDEVPSAVWWRSLPAPGGLPRPARECDGAQGGLCLQAALHSVPAAVREHVDCVEILCEARLLQCFSSFFAKLLSLLYFWCNTWGVECTKAFCFSTRIAALMKFYLNLPKQKFTLMVKLTSYSSGEQWTTMLHMIFSVKLEEGSAEYIVFTFLS